MNRILAEYDHPAWVTIAGTFVGYAMMLVLIFVVFFLAPFLLWP